jgi:ethanolamine ammonia-lyase small subunit
MNDKKYLPIDPWARLSEYTRARVGLGRSGDAMPTDALLRFQLDHAHARDAVGRTADFAALTERIGNGQRSLRVRSAAVDRATYIRRPDLGRFLDERSQSLVAAEYSAEPWDVAFVIADGLSSAAVDDHAFATLCACLQRLPGWRCAPIVLAEQARVALGDQIGALLNSNLCVVLIGERPGLSVANSLGVYLTWQPQIGRRDADRNCISNIHSDGLTYERAADTVCWLLREATRLRLSGTALKEQDAAPTHRLKRRPDPAVVHCQDQE